VEIGVWDPDTERFTPGGTAPNAVKVTTRKRQELFFARVLGFEYSDIETSAIAMQYQRDIAFVVDLSGSLNNDSEVWASAPINSTFPEYPTIGTNLMRDM